MEKNLGNKLLWVYDSPSGKRQLMIRTCHLKYKFGVLKILLFMWFMYPHVAFAAVSPLPVKSDSLIARSDDDDIDESYKKKKSKKKKKRKASRKKSSSELPSIQDLMESKYSSLIEKQSQQEEELSKLEGLVEMEKAIEDKVFDSSAYLHLGFKISASPRLYKINKLELYIDNEASPFYEINDYKRYKGDRDKLFFGALPQGCHSITAKINYTRLKNTLISRLQVQRHEVVSKTQTFITKNGYQNHISIDLFEEANAVTPFFRGVNIRFNNSVRPNFLQSAAIVSMDEVLNQGRLRVSFSNEDAQKYKLVRKSVSIDGLVIMVKDHEKENDNLLFNAPLREGKHSLNVSLLLVEKKLIKGGASYNFDLSFKRDFYILSGQTTVIDLLTLPKTGLSRNPTKTTYVKATSEIFSEENQDYFPYLTCNELDDIAKKEAELLEKQKASEKASESINAPSSVVEPVVSEPPAVPEEPKSDSLPSEQINAVPEEPKSESLPSEQPKAEPVDESPKEIIEPKEVKEE
jgi:hypothetical protein